MRFFSIILMVTATLVAATNGFSTIVDSNHENSLTSANPIGKVHAEPNKGRYLRGDTATDEERTIKIPVVDGVTEYLNQLTLKYWLMRNKKPTEVWDLLGLSGLKGRAHLKPNSRYHREYVAMWKAKKAAKEAVKNAATTT